MRATVTVAATEAGVPRLATGAVEVSGLTWRPYGRREPILADLDLVLPPGQRVLLVGPSGSGKSTLLRALAGVLEVADSGELSGSVTIDGEAPHARPGMVGLVLQEPGSGVVAATLGRDVAFGLENTGVPRSEMPGRVAEALEAVGLTMPADTPTHALSGGEQQRLALAGALALEPTLLLLDEPTAMLDPGNAAAVRACVGDVVESRHLTTVVVEHRLGPWVDFADRMVVLGRDGRVVADGPPDVVLAERGAELAERGIWVPGVPAPEPQPLPRGLFGPGPLGANEVAVDAVDVTVRRSVRLVSGGTRTTLAVDGQWLQARGGQSMALVGPSGSGKSTLLLALAGLVRADDGAVRVHPKLARHGSRNPADFDTVDLARTVAWVPQWSSSTIVAGTVLDEVMATARAVGLVESEAQARALALLDLLGLGHLAQADPRHLSGGEQRRLAMAAAVVHQPALLLADEATVGQDRLTWAAVTGVVEGLRDAGSAVVLTTHDDAVVARCDRSTVLERPVQPPAPPAPRRPLAGRCGPLSLLAASTLAIPAGVLSPHWSATLLVVGVQALLAAVALASPGAGPRPSGRLRGVLTRLLPGAIGALSVAWSSWLLGGRDLEVAAGAGLRVLAIVLPSAVLVPFIDADALGDHLAQRLRLPARPVVATAAALQRVHTFGDIWADIARARRVRGLGASRRSPRAVLAELGALTVGMLIRSLQAAATLAVAMDARGFSTAYRRTWWAAAPWRAADTLLVLASLLPLAVALLARALL
jgi:energy-coupling factor transport system ATP-binding protein